MKQNIEVQEVIVNHKLKINDLMNHNFLRVSGPRNNTDTGTIDTYFGVHKVHHNNKNLKCLLCHQTFKGNERILFYRIEDMGLSMGKTKNNSFHFSCFLEAFLEVFSDQSDFTDYFKGFQSGFRLGREYKSRKPKKK